MRYLVWASMVFCGCFSATGSSNCTVGTQQPCACPGGGQGVQTCKSDGSFDVCKSCPSPTIDFALAGDMAMMMSDSCSDGMLDGDETDVDCGGSCAKCAVGKGCSTGTDCQSASCSSGICCGVGTGNCDGNAANGCEANLLTDAKNCNSCGNACPNNQSCANGMCSGGPKVCNGLQPPTQCMAGADMETGDQWVVCFASCNSAWISHSEANGPQYGAKFHALQICQSLGYGTVAKWGCSYECAWCQDNPATCGQPGGMFFENNGVDGNCGNDQFGPILCGNIDWLCTP